jgi:hypothetical protein
MESTSRMSVEEYKRHMTHKVRAWKPKRVYAGNTFSVFMFHNREDYNNACLDVEYFNNWYRYKLAYNNSYCFLMVGNSVPREEETTNDI